MSVKVIDLNEEIKPEEPTLETIEEAKEENKTAKYDEDDNEEIKNKVTEQTNEQPKEEPKQEAPKPKRQTQKDKMTCGKCGKEMTIKSYKYSHEKNCQGQLSERPVKKQAKPKAKTKAKATIQQKPAPEVYYSESEEEDKPLSKPEKNQFLKQPSHSEGSFAQSAKPQPTNPVNALYQHYQLLQEQMLQKKQERYNKVCQNMFMSIPKKR